LARTDWRIRKQAIVMTSEEEQAIRDEERAQEEERQKSLKRLRERFKDYPDSIIEKQIQSPNLNNAQRQVFVEILAERRHNAEQAENRRYEQTERHHKEAKRLAWTAAVISIIGALASWSGVLIQSHRASPVQDAPPASTPQQIVTSPTPTAQS
jgi:hypothetical protein